LVINSPPDLPIFKESEVEIAFVKPIVDGVVEARQQVRGAVKAGRWVHWVVFGMGGGGLVL
jgi:hypothetical protein